MYPSTAARPFAYESQRLVQRLSRWLKARLVALLAAAGVAVVFAAGTSAAHAQTPVGWGVNTLVAPVVPTDLGPISKIAAGGYHTVALKQDGTVAC